MTHITVKRLTPMPLINDDDPPSKKRKLFALRSTLKRSWTIKLLKSSYAPIIITFLGLFLACACAVVGVKAEQWFTKEKVVTVAPWTYVRTARAAEVNHKPLTIEDYICTKEWDCKTAVAVAKAESGLRCDAQNVNKGTNSLDLGVMQINSVHLKKGWKVADLLDCHKNVDLAYEIYKGSGWGAWSTYKNGSYKKRL